jgi:hypothetical protein
MVNCFRNFGWMSISDTLITDNKEFTVVTFYGLMTPYSLVGGYKHFRGTCCLSLWVPYSISSEKLIPKYQVIWCHNPEGYNLNFQCSENLSSYTGQLVG